MTTSEKTLDPHSWLFERLREANELIPNATLADGLEYAMIAAEHENQPWEVSDMVNLLSKTHSYKLRTPDEVWWRFHYDDFVDYTGHHWGWQVYVCTPGELKLHRIGMWPETSVYEQLERFGHPLDGGDWDDLRFYINVQWEQDIASERVTLTA